MQANITIDARWLVGGIGTYTRHLLKELKANGNGFRLRAITREQHKAELEPLCHQISILNSPIYTLREQWAVPRLASGCDLLHVPHYNAPLFSRTPCVITVHDVIHLVDPEYRGSMRSTLYANPVLQLACRRSRHIVTVSEFSKSQIVEQLQVPAEKITVIHNGVSDRFRPMDRREAAANIRAGLKIEPPYILYVGSFKEYKNLSTLLRAFALVDSKRPLPHTLLLVGNDTVRWPTLAREANQLEIADRVLFRDGVSDELLPSVYAAADVCVLPSRIEGFGLPVLEAMACATPVVCANAASLPEVGGDAVRYFDPLRVDALADALEQVLSSASFRHDLATKGLERANQFRWSASARAHLAVYDRVLSGK